ncbi:MAG: 50S ribosomal protein L4 [Candidatus Woesearchaeota archaeon]|nr:50S ribosomal protein L4 [Candidatus Woesearchaeota archaeon]
MKVMTAEKEAGSVSLPPQFSEPVRNDLIQRAVLALQSKKRQPYGSYGNAGLRHSTRISKRRSDYRTSYGKGISRVPRKILTRRGTQMYWVGAEAPGTVGGRRAHPPKPYKNWEQKINQKENRKAIRSAMAATVDKELVVARGHKIPENFPFALDNSFEKIAKTNELTKALEQLGFAAELLRGANRKIRAGKGTMRNRKYKQAKTFLFVVSSREAALMQAAMNVPGADVVSVEALNAELLAPGTHPGRLTLYTQAALDRVEKEKLFTQNYKGPSPEKKVRVTKVAVKKVENAPATKKPKETPQKTTKVEVAQ